MVLTLDVGLDWIGLDWGFRTRVCYNRYIMASGDEQIDK